MLKPSKTYLSGVFTISLWWKPLVVSDCHLQPPDREITYQNITFYQLEMERVVNSMEANAGGTKPTVAKTITSL